MKTLTLSLFVFFSISTYGQDYSIKQLEQSPRHHEWVTIESQGRNIRCFVAYPEKAKNTEAIIVIHENRGLTDWVRSFADQLAAAGYLAIAPDLLSDFSEEVKQTSDFATSDDARKGIYALPADQVTRDLQAVEKYIAKAPSSNGNVLVAGFCWGGSQSFRYATNSTTIKAAMVFYGTAPDSAEELHKIKVPVYGFYGGDDQRVNATIEATEAIMKDGGKTYAYEIYAGAGHAYMRRGDDPESDEANKKARDDSWERIKLILKKVK